MSATGIDERAVCDSSEVGAGTRVAAFATVATGARLGEGCTIASFAAIRDGAVLGDGTVVHEGAVVGGGARTEIGQGVTVGANATVVAGVAVGRNAVIADGAVVTEPVPANALVRGNPASIVGYSTSDPVVDREGPAAAPVPVRVGPTLVPRVELLAMTRVDDLRGTLSAVEFTETPFVPRRVFSVSRVPNEIIRGGHAHRVCEQLLICVAGSVSCLIDDGHVREDIRLTGPEIGLHLPAMIWGAQYRYSADAVLLVLASHPYEADDYIRDYDEFCVEAGSA